MGSGAGRATCDPSDLGWGVVIAASILTLVAFGSGCAGSRYRFDPAPAPDWLQRPAAVEGDRVVAIGGSPTTVEVARDLDLATRDAARQIGLMFEAKVKSSATDWSASIQSGLGAKEVSVLDSSIRVETNVKVEGARVERSFRDETSRTHYVEVSVDASDWSKRLRSRISANDEELRSRLAEVARKIDSGSPLRAQAALFSAVRLAAELEPDVVVLSLLDPNGNGTNTLQRSKDELAKLQQRLRNDFCVTFRSDAVAASADLERDLARFFGEMGYEAKGGGCAAGTIEIRARLVGRRLREEPVAERVELVYEAAGDLEVLEPGQRSVPELRVELPSGSHLVRDTDAGVASKKALELAASTIAGQLRSRLRALLGG
ncbi:MAG: hypothetical protein HYV07_27810 [Deltaproteobacteria bacterium]|nr:hypothetical protein [Deltaproteobacteria bacterium]